jgi:hypothetical protein
VTHDYEPRNVFTALLLDVGSKNLKLNAIHKLICESPLEIAISAALHAVMRNAVCEEWMKSVR